jgi:hypothetical protein
MTEGLAIKISLNKKDVNYEIDPISITHAQASLMNATNTQIILNSLSESAVVSDDIKMSIASGTINIFR